MRQALMASRVGRCATFAGIGIAAMGWPMTAQAATSEPAPSISDSTPAYGQTITVESGSGACTPGTQGFVGFHFYASEEPFENETPVADATGNLKATYTIPTRDRLAPIDNGTNRHIVEFACDGQDATFTVEFALAESAASTDDELPYTGTAEALLSGAVGAVLVLAGTAALMVSRPRNTTRVSRT